MQVVDAQQFRNAVFSQHARSQMWRRGINESEVLRVLDAPEQVRPVRDGRVVAQAVDAAGLLLRVFVAAEPDPPVIVTVYRTSKIAKYRGG